MTFMIQSSIQDQGLASSHFSEHALHPISALSHKPIID